MTARYLGKFLDDPIDGVPWEVLDFLAGQLEITDPSCVKAYSERLVFGKPGLPKGCVDRSA